ncbi:Trafficking protein particle complex subunit 13 [Trametes pubescens]|uniref:Trafficking protein particle complex subunit 13 n=1 Tax=Trametes pubescens TaxID=154538 RepID=A0A1M2W2S4_TRAPU|nr:Trafficking protein particle complex subunit 13 [Trametes pubescens]
MDGGGGQLLSLKVMRVSRPSLASAWEPFYSSSPSFSAHSTASIASLQGKTPLPGHPKTLRDLTHITDLLTLPAAFGAIQLGETFSSCLSINNDANIDVDGVVIRVEMQTASSKVLLAEFGGPNQRLGVGETLEKVVSHEIKELGQHVLGCSVSYRVPPGVRHLPQAADSQDPSIQTFRKFYKFAVTNPLSVKTKVHLPRSPTALLSAQEREKVFLEVHIQNLTQDAMWLERMQFECVDGWQVQDANIIENTVTGAKEYVFSGTTALMQPQDLRQYIYILSLKSPQLQQRPGSPPVNAGPAPYRPGSPRIRPMSAGPPARPQSPGPVTTFAPTTPRPLEDVEADLVVTSIPRDSIAVDKPFTIGFKLTVQAPAPVPRPNEPRRQRIISLVVQHAQPPKQLTVAAAVASAVATSTGAPQGAWSPRLPSSGFSTPSPYGTPLRGDFTDSLAQRLLVASPRRMNADIDSEAGTDGGETPGRSTHSARRVIDLPPPELPPSAEPHLAPTDSVTFLGTSALFLPPLRLPVPNAPPSSMGHSRGVSDSTDSSADSDAEDLASVLDRMRVNASQEFELSYMPLKTGFAAVGGLRVLLVEDRLADEEDATEGIILGQYTTEPRTLKEWDVVSEVWVRS